VNAAPSGDFYSVLNVSLARIAAYTSGCIAEKLLFTTFRNPEISSEMDLSAAYAQKAEANARFESWDRG
jgi:hypothetical protein